MIKYFKTQYIDSSTDSLARVTELDDIIFGEFWRQGSWIRSDNALQFLLGDTPSEVISEDDAMQITAQYLAKKNNKMDSKGFGNPSCKTGKPCKTSSGKIACIPKSSSCSSDRDVSEEGKPRSLGRKALIVGASVVGIAGLSLAAKKIFASESSEENLAGSEADGRAEDIRKLDRMGIPSNTFNSYFDKGEPSQSRVGLHSKIEESVIGSKGLQSREGKPRAYLMIGGPGAGKSTVRGIHTQNLEGFDPVVIDTDAIKEQIPEYQKAVKSKIKTAGHVVHKEAAYLSSRFQDKSILEGRDVVLDRLAFSRPNGLRDQVNQLRQKGYDIEVVAVKIDPSEGIKRIGSRFKETGRYVPTSVANSVYKNVDSAIAESRKLGLKTSVYDNNGSKPKLIG